MRSPINKVRNLIKKIYLFLLPESINTHYLEFKIFHHKYDSLIPEINKNKNKIYEENETSVIIRHLKEQLDPVVIDIGANIGLMSINICHFLKGATIYAFEPGPNQFKYLLQNVIQNNLGARIFPFNLALSSKSGQIEFHIHNVKDSSGDGIIDTGRAGESRIIRVESTTLDDWWTQSNKPKVNFIKIDTEGAELQILNSANQLIQQYRPPILLEICYLNYEKYGLQFEDYIITLNSMNYTLFDLKQQNAITCSNYLPYKDHFYYLALPNAVENN